MSNDLDLMLYKAANSIILPAAYTGAATGLVGLAMAGSKHSPFESPAERRARLRDAALVSGAIGATVGGSVKAITNNKDPVAEKEVEISPAARIANSGWNAAKGTFAYAGVPFLANSFMRTMGYDWIGPSNTGVPSNVMRWIGQKGTLGGLPRGQLSELINREESLGNVPDAYKEILRKSYNEGMSGTDATKFVKHVENRANTIQSKINAIAGNQNSILNVLNGNANISGLTSLELASAKKAIRNAYGIKGNRRVSALDLQKVDTSRSILKRELLKSFYNSEFGEQNSIRSIVGMDSKLRYGGRNNIYKNLLKIDDALQKTMGTTGETAAGRLLTRMLENKSLIRRTKDLSIGKMRRLTTGLGKLSVPALASVASPFIWDFIKNKD